MNKHQRKAVEEIRDSIEENLAALESIRDLQTRKDEVEILTDCCGNLKEAADHLGEI